MRNVNKKGFTLLEMVAVLVIILVLAGLAIPTYQAVIGETRENAAVLSAKAFRNSIDTYAAGQQIAPDEIGEAGLLVLAAELPGYGTAVDSDVRVSGTDTASVTVTAEYGSDDKSACITLSSAVGGFSTVAESACGVAVMNWVEASGTVTNGGTPSAFITVFVLKEFYPEEGAPFFGFRYMSPSGAENFAQWDDPTVVKLTTNESGEFSFTFTDLIGAGTYQFYTTFEGGIAGLSDVVVITGPGAPVTANITNP